MHWARQYIGLPFVLGGRTKEGLDCWGLVKVVYQEVKGIELPDFAGTVGAAALAAKMQGPDLQAWQEIAEPTDGCMVAMSQKRHIIHHVGLWAAVDGGKVVHASGNGISVVCDTLRVLRLKGYKVFKYYQYGIRH